MTSAHNGFLLFDPYYSADMSHGKKLLTVTVMFRLQRPVMTDFSPRIGPKSGGTILTVQGRNLDIGSRLNITVGYLPCFLVK